MSVPAEDLPYGPGNPDYEFDGARQRLLDAFIDGRKAGCLGLPVSLNPFEHDPAAAAEWERGRRTTDALRAAEYMKNRARCVCIPCTCGGKGLCRDAA